MDGGILSECEKGRGRKTKGIMEEYERQGKKINYFFSQGEKIEKMSMNEHNEQRVKFGRGREERREEEGKRKRRKKYNKK